MTEPEKTTLGHKPQLASGARGVITFKDSAGNPITLGYATDITLNRRDQLMPTYVIGEYGPKTLEPLAIDADCSIGRFIYVNSSSASGTPADGKATNTYSLKFEELYKDLGSAAAVEIALIDKNNQPIGTLKEARFTGRSLSVNSGDVARESLNFVGIYIAVGTRQVAEKTGYETAAAGDGQTKPTATT
jgi:hypothetical protein